jgi:aryl-alcohol dehydrogenase-like predicted oxidoreductase
MIVTRRSDIHVLSRPVRLCDHSGVAAPATEIPLVLGGHSFISELGNDPPLPESRHPELVESCLDHGIRWFDTTYPPERLALGRALQAVRRRDDATILAWNFFRGSSSTGSIEPPQSYQPGHIDVILDELRTDHVDALVLVPSDDLDEHLRQRELLIGWQKHGYVARLGLWVESAAALELFRGDDAFGFMVRPFNVTTATDGAIFESCRRAGRTTIATSPFVRGWELDRIVAAASARARGNPDALRSSVADLMLRFSLFQPGVDHVIVGIRKVAWVRQNADSVRRGPLSDAEQRRLRELHRIAKGRGWLGRLGRLLRRRLL